MRRTTPLFFAVLLGGLLAVEGGQREAFSKPATAKSHTILVRAGRHGSMAPSGMIKVNHGKDQAFAIMPDQGFEISDVKIDGKTIGPVSTYTFTNITRNHTIQAVFKLKKMEEKTEFYSAFPGTRKSFVSPGPPVENSERLIEEGDIVKVSGDTLFILNPNRGLTIIDITNLNDPSLQSRVPIYGLPIEIYVRGDRAYVAVSDFCDYSFLPLRGTMESFSGSYVGIVDVKDKKAPKVLGGIRIEGEITDTRMVGDILYVVSNRNLYSPAGSLSLTTLYSISVSDPSDVKVVDELSFEGKSISYQNNVHVTPSMAFLSRAGWGYYNESGKWVEDYSTETICVDISDEGGVIRKGSSFNVPGVVQNRWQMDFYNGYFRVITPERSWGNGFPSLYVYRVDSPGAIKEISRLTLKIDRPESLTSVRFDGERAYAVTFERKDPLFTIDLKDPMSPRQRGEIQMPGWLDYIEPRADHLVALGHDDSGGQASLAVSLFDVSRMEEPALLSRVVFGEDWGSVPTETNDIRKAFKVLDESHLILVPFNAWSSKDGQEISRVQVIDYFYDDQIKTLTKRGLIPHSGWVERAIPVREEKVLTVSNEAFQVVDISNRDNPQIKKVLELARNSVDFATFHPGEGLELTKSSMWAYSGRTKSKLSIVPLANPNTPEPIDSLEMAGDYFKLFQMKDFHALVGNDQDQSGDPIISIKALRYEGAVFNVLGALELPGVNPGPILKTLVPILPFLQRIKVQKISDEAIILVREDNPYRVFAADSANQVVLTAVDFSNPQAIRVAAEVSVDLTGGYFTHSFWEGNKFYLSYAVPSGEQKGKYYYKYYFKGVDFSDFHHPLISKEVNVPGDLAGISRSGQYLYTVDYQYPAGLETSSYEVYLNSLELIEDKAYLRDRKMIVPDPGNGKKYDGIGKMAVKDQKAYSVAYRSQCAKDGSDCKYDSDLITADFLDPSNIRFPSSLNLGVEWADIVDLVQGRLFLYAYGGGGAVLVCSLEDPSAPSLLTSLRTGSQPENIKVIEDSTYLSLGMYGVQVIPPN
jgi:uncharacterized secreted protein with C-terminal beta-propeller domain